MKIVAAEAGDAAIVHQALPEILALQAAPLRSAAGKMRKAGFARQTA